MATLAKYWFLSDTSQDVDAFIDAVTLVAFATHDVNVAFTANVLFWNASLGTRIGGYTSTVALHNARTTFIV